VVIGEFGMTFDTLLLAAGDTEVAISGIVFGTGLIIAITAIIAGTWGKTRRASENAQLKALMLQRGMSVEEIERVCRAGGEKE
jgi:hypothetical protein